MMQAGFQTAKHGADEAKFAPFIFMGLAGLAEPPSFRRVLEGR
jgi:hypothetical protein